MAGLSLYSRWGEGAWALIFGFPSLIRAVDQRLRPETKLRKTHYLTWMREPDFLLSLGDSGLHETRELSLPRVRERLQELMLFPPVAVEEPILRMRT